MDGSDPVLGEAVGWVLPVDIERMEDVEDRRWRRLGVVSRVSGGLGELLQWGPVPELQCRKGDVDVG